MKNRRFLDGFLHTLPILLLLFCCSATALATDVALEWDASSSSGITGYKVYYGNSSHTYGAPITIGNQTNYTVSGLPNGTYYFAVTAFDAIGNESDFSNEISQVIGAPTNKCDLNADSLTNALDLQLLVNVILSAGSGIYDLNGDGSINVLDLQLLNNAILTQGSCQ